MVSVICFISCLLPVSFSIAIAAAAQMIVVVVVVVMNSYFGADIWIVLLRSDDDCDIY